MPLLAGCTTPAERDFTVADVRVIGLYVAVAQAAAEARANDVAAAGEANAAAQLRADSRALAGEVMANAAARLKKLSADEQAKAAAQAALDVAGALLDWAAQRKAVGSDANAH
jgi:outer membrane murein-binding lipoprotein Lpp